MQKLWTDNGWEDYLYWQTNDKKTIKRINQIINFPLWFVSVRSHCRSHLSDLALLQTVEFILYF